MSEAIFDFSIFSPKIFRFLKIRHPKNRKFRPNITMGNPIVTTGCSEGFGFEFAKKMEASRASPALRRSSGRCQSSSNTKNYCTIHPRHVESRRERFRAVCGVSGSENPKIIPKWVTSDFSESRTTPDPTVVLLCDFALCCA